MRSDRVGHLSPDHLAMLEGGVWRDPAQRAVYADWLRDRGWDEAADAVAAARCQRCGIPDDAWLFHRDPDGGWWASDVVDRMDTLGLFLVFGGLVPPPSEYGHCEPQAFRGGFVWACRVCRRHYGALKAADTKRAKAGVPKQVNA